MPSTVSSVVSRPFASSTVMTPSLPTFSIASAIRLPISLSLFAEIAPTWAISFRPAVGTEIFFSSSTTASTARSIPRFNDIGFEPAVTDLRPSRKIAWASTVAVVVPSPARSDVLVATSFTIWAPMFSIGSSSSISFATVTPSFVTVGFPNFLSMTTFRPLGPSVTFTASPSWSTPRLSRARASVLNSSCFAGIVRFLLRASAQLGDDVGFFDEDDLFTLELDLGAAVLAVHHAVPDLQLHRHHIPFFPAPGTHRDDLTLDRLLLGRVGDIETALHRLRLLRRPDGHAIRERVHLELRLRCRCGCHVPLLRLRCSGRKYIWDNRVGTLPPRVLKPTAQNLSSRPGHVKWGRWRVAAWGSPPESPRSPGPARRRSRPASRAGPRPPPRSRPSACPPDARATRSPPAARFPG